MTGTKDQPGNQMSPSREPAERPVIEPELRNKLDVLFWHFYSEYDDLAVTVKSIVDELNAIRPLFLGTESQAGMLEQMRVVSSHDAKTVAELHGRLNEVVRGFDAFEQRVSDLVRNSVSDAFLAEQGQRLLVEVSQRLAQQSAKEALNKALAVITGELKDGAQKIADEALAEHHVRTVTELQAQNRALKLQLDAALDKRSARIEGALQNMVIAFVAGALICASALYFGMKFM